MSVREIDETLTSNPPAKEEQNLVAKILDENDPMPQSVAAANAREFFSSGRFTGNYGDMMTAALNDPGRFYNDPYFQAFLRQHNQVGTAPHTMAIKDTKAV